MLLIYTNTIQGKSLMPAFTKLPKLVILKGLLILAVVHVVFHKRPYKTTTGRKRGRRQMSLYDYDVIWQGDKFCCLCLNSGAVSYLQLQPNFPTSKSLGFDWVTWNNRKKKAKYILQRSFHLRRRYATPVSLYFSEERWFAARSLSLHKTRWLSAWSMDNGYETGRK